VETMQVATMPFARALTDDITFVKMDCEGAEVVCTCETTLAGGMPYSYEMTHASYVWRFLMTCLYVKWMVKTLR